MCKQVNIPLKLYDDSKADDPEPICRVNVDFITKLLLSQTNVDCHLIHDLPFEDKNELLKQFAIWLRASIYREVNMVLRWKFRERYSHAFGTYTVVGPNYQASIVTIYVSLIAVCISLCLLETDEM